MRELLRCGLFSLLLFSKSGYGQSSDTNGAKLSSVPESAKASSTTSSSRTHSAITPTFGNGTCPSRTANYITHTLPQQCLRTDRATSTTNATSTTDASTEHSGSSLDSVVSTAGPEKAATKTVSGSESLSSATLTAETTGLTAASPSSSSSSTSAVETEDDSDSPLDNANFLSFDEWKKQNLAKLESDQGRNVPLNSDRQRPGINNALETLGDEGEIDLDFSGFGQSPSGPSQPRAAYRQPDASSPSEVPTSQTIRSKDAGKTCKERTNYASFDCSAQVLKHNPECKSPYSVLVENKDSYMLNTCSAQNKFFIVELCNDILVDTVVLANYEFFSSIFRHFRVSVSDRYPVKMEKWRELGTFEARNTREIQAFLVEQPQIWARYVRIEFLTHYGSEYYCPVSLLRVHGINMLEDVRPQDEIGHGETSEDEGTLELESEASAILAQDSPMSTQELNKTTTSHTEASAALPSQTDPSTSQGVIYTDSDRTNISPVTPLPEFTGQNASIDISTLPGPELPEMTCSTNLTSSASQSSSSLSHPTPEIDRKQNESDEKTSTQEVNATKLQDSATEIASMLTSPSNATNATSATSTPSYEKAVNVTGPESRIEDEPISSVLPSNITSVSTDTNTSQASSSTNTTRTVPATAASSIPPPQPSTQESFFKSLSKRLQQLESNSTLSLQYIEEQSRILRDAFSKVEKRQISSTSNFLVNLNDTVIKELHGFRQAYDQLWQSTVLELEGQREQYQREMLVLSSRLTLVADELLWQKRMGIIQSGLLLLCLGLVLFARTGLQGHLEVPLMQQMMNKSSAALSRAGWESPPASPSPENRSPVALFRRKLWRSATEPERVATDGDVTGTDSRPDTRDGPNVDVFVEPPTPPRSRGTDSETMEVYDDVDADDEEEVVDPRESQSGPSTPTGTRDIIDRDSDMANGVIAHGVG